MNKRPITTLFMLESLDGKINSGSNDSLDVDRDWKKIPGVREGLDQYYAIEQTTDLCSFNTGRVMAKIGINERDDEPTKSPCTFVIIDNKPHLNAKGLAYLSKWVTKLILVTTNKNHPVFENSYENIICLLYEELDLVKILEDLYSKEGIERITIQSGGNMNGLFLRENLIDYLDIVIAPILVGGSDTSTLIDGESISSPTELNKLRALELLECNRLDDSYIELKYRVRKND